MPFKLENNQIGETMKSRFRIVISNPAPCSSIAPDSNAISLSEYAVQSNDPLVLKITKSLLVNGIVLADIPLISKKTLKAMGVMWKDNLPTVNWAKLNAGTTVTKGKPTAYEEQIYLLRNAIDTDIKLLEEENAITDPRGTQLDAYLQSVAYDFNDKFINNDHISGDANSIVGLRYRLNNVATYNLNSDMMIDAATLDLSQGGITAANANKFIEFIQQMFTYMGRDDGDGVVLYMNDTMKRRFAFAVRLLGAGAGWSMTKDAYDRVVTKFMNARIVDIGRKASQSSFIITNTENTDGTAGSSNQTSIYAACYGEERLIGWQYDSLGNSIRDIGLIGNDGTMARILIDWAVGLFPQHTRCMARLYDIKIK